MSFENALGNMSREKFRQTANKLLNKCYLMKKRDDTRLDYLYVITNKNIFSEFFELIGYSLKIDETQGVIGLTCTEKSVRIKLKKYESILLLIFRLLYAQERNSLSLSDEVVVRMEQVQEKFALLKIKNKTFIDKSTLQSGISFLCKYNIIDKLDYDILNPDTRIIIYPSILFATPTEDIDAVYQATKNKLDKYAGGAEDNEEDLQDTID